MRFKILLVLILINFIPLYAVIPIELEGDFESEAEYIKDRNDYALRFFSKVAEPSPKWNDTTYYQRKIDHFLSIPQNEELFSASYLDYHKDKSTISPFITSLFAGWTLGFIIANTFDLQDQNLLIPAAFSIGYGSYLSIYAKGLEFELAKKNDFPRNPINNCLSFKFLDQNWKCEFEENLPLHIAQTPQKLAEIKNINSSILTKIDSSDTTNPIIDSAQFIANTKSNITQIIPPKINLEASKKWMHLLNSNNPDFKSESQNALYKMNFVLQNIKKTDSSQLENLYHKPIPIFRPLVGLGLIYSSLYYSSQVENFDLVSWSLLGAGTLFYTMAYLDLQKIKKSSIVMDSLYNQTQNYDLKIPYNEEESKFWIKQLGPNFNYKLEDMHLIYDMKTFLDSNRIPSEIYNKRTLLNSERSSAFWHYAKGWIAVIGTIATLSLANPKPATALAFSIPTGLSYYGLIKDYQFNNQKELEQSKWREYYNTHRDDHPKQNTSTPFQQELNLFK